MYGFVLEGVGATIRARFSEETWKEIIHKAHLHTTTFTNDKRYSESAAPRIMKASGSPLHQANFINYIFFFQSKKIPEYLKEQYSREVLAQESAHLHKDH